MTDADRAPLPVSSEPPISRGGPRAFVLALAILHVALIVIGLATGLVGAMLIAMPAAFAVMMFDDPAAGSVIWTYLLAVGLMTAPVVLAGAAIVGCLPLMLSLVGVVRASPAFAVVGVLLTVAIFAVPLLNVAAVIVGAVGLDVYCDGQFGCGG